MAKKKSASELKKANKTRAKQEAKTPASTTKARGQKMKQGGYTTEKRKKAAKKAWKTRRAAYGEKGYKNKPGPKGPRKKAAPKLKGIKTGARRTARAKAANRRRAKTS